MVLRTVRASPKRVRFAFLLAVSGKFGLAIDTLRGKASVDTMATVLGRHVRSPILLAPAGRQRALHSDGEMLCSTKQSIGEDKCCSLRSK